MTTYAGRIAQVRVHAEDYDDVALGPDDVTLSITIWDLDTADPVLVDEATMSHSDTIVFKDGTVGGWFYAWDSPAVAGSYLARCTVTGDGVDTIAFKRIRLRRPKP